MCKAITKVTNFFVSSSEKSCRFQVLTCGRLDVLPDIHILVQHTHIHMHTHTNFVVGMLKFANLFVFSMDQVAESREQLSNHFLLWGWVLISAEIGQCPGDVAQEMDLMIATINISKNVYNGLTNLRANTNQSLSPTVLLLLSVSTFWVWCTSASMGSMAPLEITKFLICGPSPERGSHNS